MDTVVAYETKTHLARLLGRVAQGETLAITCRAQAVARLAPVDDDERRRSRRPPLDDMPRRVATDLKVTIFE